MSGAMAAIQRVFVMREQHALDPDQIEVLAELAARVRELTEAVVFTDVDAAEVSEVAEEVAELTARLSAFRRSAPPIAQLDGHGVVRQLASPVSGRLNPIAPPVEIKVSPDRTVHCEFTLSAVYEGPPGFVHGGISALILDQLLGAAAAANGTPGMTATLDVRYRRPTPLGVPLTAEAKATRVDGRKTYVDAFVFGPDGKPTIEASAMFIMPIR
ncbi:MAG: thioesterase superfamily protein [Actinomycetia bacterium]|nr:thioesterase superfamily protein [Actinomycetes bacterium]